ncbi:hypothetical protein IEI94_09835 [Halomonas sp. ML-15]|uniref:hypothetical protein n=1 Tax=Halomonas sp. ML-15 TaxID=2773305 RepID=UPI001746981F|nr:hypothetical protein [Halomonas sp. ML-15]MBD3896150.1 hypothetical protein [Halomonas sp. ML-15]
MTNKLDAEQRFAKNTARYTRRAYNASLSSGQTVIEVVDGNLVETYPNGTRHILKKAPPKHKVSAGMKLKVT